MKRSVAILKSAGIEAAKVKAGDASATPEAIRLYTEGLVLLQEAVSSGNYNEKVVESLNKKARGVRKRLRDLGGKAAASPKKPAAASKTVIFKEDAASPSSSPSRTAPALSEEDMAVEVKEWTGQTAKATKSSPVYSGIELTGAKLHNCKKGEPYTILEAGHHKGKLALCVADCFRSLLSRCCF